jgi:phosphoadenosine phosphosulfate reductase
MTNSRIDSTCKSLAVLMAVTASALTTEEISATNRALANATAHQIVDWAYNHFGGRLAVSTSFGMNAAATLSVTHRGEPPAPVIWVDTGYLPAETHSYAKELTSKFGLTVHKYQAKMSTSEMVNKYGKLWQMDSPQASKLYDMLRKVEPMARSVRELNVTAVIAGVQREQIPEGRSVEVITIQNGIFKICPFLTWTTSDMDQYLLEHALSHHPLKGLYKSIGDLHSMEPIAPPVPDSGSRETCQEVEPQGVLLLGALLIVVLSGLMMLWRKCESDSVAEASRSQVSMISTTHQAAEPLDSVHEGSYFTVSGATGAMLMKELQTELQGGIDVQRVNTMRDNYGVSFAQPDFWVKNGPSAPVSKKALALQPLSPQHREPLAKKDAKQNAHLNSFTVSGASGSHLAQELQRALHRRKACAAWAP